MGYGASCASRRLRGQAREELGLLPPPRSRPPTSSLLIASMVRSPDPRFPPPRRDPVSPSTMPRVCFMLPSTMPLPDPTERRRHGRSSPPLWRRRERRRFLDSVWACGPAQCFLFYFGKTTLVVVPCDSHRCFFFCCGKTTPVAVACDSHCCWVDIGGRWCHRHRWCTSPVAQA